MKKSRFFKCLGIDRDRLGKVLRASCNHFRVSRARGVDNFRSWWWRSVSSPLQVSGAVTRLAVYRAALHNSPARTSAEKAVLQFKKKFSENLSCGVISAIHFRRRLNPAVL